MFGWAKEPEVTARRRNACAIEKHHGFQHNSSNHEETQP